MASALWSGPGALMGASVAADAPAAAPCEPDGALLEAATALLLDGRAPSATRLNEALRDAGSDLPGVRALRARVADEAALRVFLRESAGRADAPLACGDAQGEVFRVLLLAPRGGALALARDTGGAPGELAGAPRERVRVTLAPGFADAYLAGRDAEDRLHRWAVDDDVLAEGFALPPDLPRPVELQLVAVGPDGPRPVARRVVGGPAGATAATMHSPSVDGDDDLPTRVATLRAQEGVRDLRVNRLLAAEASAHAERVCSSGQVRHQGVAGDTDDPRTRLERRGVAARVVGETVARGRTLRAALRALSESPSHRMTLVDPRFTDVGFGTVRAQGDTCVVALFAAWPRYVPR